MPKNSWWGRWPSFLRDVFRDWIGIVSGIGSILLTVLALSYPQYFSSIHVARSAFWTVAVFAYVLATRSAWDQQWRGRDNAEAQLRNRRPQLRITIEPQAFSLHHRMERTFRLGIQHLGGDAARSIQLDPIEPQMIGGNKVEFQQIDCLNRENSKAFLYSNRLRRIAEFDEEFNWLLCEEAVSEHPRVVTYRLCLRFLWGNSSTQDIQRFCLVWNPMAQTLRVDEVLPAVDTSPFKEPSIQPS